MNRIAILEGYTAPFGAYRKRKKRRTTTRRRRATRKTRQQSKMGKCARKCKGGRRSYRVCMRKCLRSGRRVKRSR